MVAATSIFERRFLLVIIESVLSFVLRFDRPSGPASRAEVRFRQDVFIAWPRGFALSVFSEESVNRVEKTECHERDFCAARIDLVWEENRTGCYTHQTSYFHPMAGRGRR